MLCAAHAKARLARPVTRNRPKIRTAVLHIRCTPEQRAKWERAADAAGLTLTEWVSRACDEQSDFELRRHS